MVHHWGLFFILTLSLSALGQDERYYRQILSGELPDVFKTYKENLIQSISVTGASYKIDLNSDGIEETIQPQKRDGVDWIEIRDSSERKIFQGSLFAMGAESVLYKIKLVHLSKTLRALILFLDEGRTQGRKFESTARLYVLSYENNDLSTLKLSAGPHFFHEREAQRDQYFRRDYVVNVVDFDEDGTREISVQFNRIQRIMQYTGNGDWKIR
jgi:hypothetical protein